MHSNLLGLRVIKALTGFVVVASVVGCGSDSSTTSTSTGGGGSGGGGDVPKCGNGTVEGTEVCDDGNTVSGDGCEADCTFSCDKGDPASVAKCDDGNPCNGVETCSDTHVCTPTMAATDGSSCGTAKICVMGMCVDEVCGDGFVSSNEECDDSNMVNGDGCDTCKFSCLSTDVMRDCSMADVCTGNVCDDKTHMCSNALPDGDVCAQGSVCIGGICTMAVCGDGKVQAGEECDDGNTMDGDGCQSDCTLVPVGSICGNGVRDAGEECDDSNTKNLDGCDSKCNFEQVQRATWLHMQYAPEEPFCPANRLGSAISIAAQGQMQTALDTGVQNGSISIMFKMLGLGDLSGMSDPAVEVGLIAGGPVAGAGYDGTKDLDWWYTINASTIDASRNPIQRLAGYITASTLTAGPGTLSLGINFAGTPALLKMTSARLTASIGASSAPLMSAGTTTPGHLASENLDPMLQSYASTGQPNNAGAGQLCGNVSALSLDQIPAPAALIMSNPTCEQGYTTQNSLLDILVGGCSAFGGLIRIIAATQPDQADPAAPVAGAGAPYTFTTNAMTKAVTGCRDKNGQTADLNTCLTAAAYSGFFKFATGRVIPK